MRLIIYSLLILFSTNIFSQSSDNKSTKIEFGTELGLYPVGYMPTITSNVFIKENLALRFRLGGNFADRKDFSGINDDEVANGFGASVGIVKYFTLWKGNIIAGFTTDFWRMKTQWKDAIQSGETKNLVVQPWINGGYLYDFSNKFNAGLTLGFGREINTFNQGEEVGQGWIGILTISANYSIN